MRSRIFAIEYSYEYNKNSVSTIDDRIDWFFRLDVLETIYDEEILHYRMSRSSFRRYIHFDFAAFRAISRNRLIQINF